MSIRDAGVNWKPRLTSTGHVVIPPGVIHILYLSIYYIVLISDTHGDTHPSNVHVHPHFWRCPRKRLPKSENTGGMPWRIFQAESSDQESSGHQIDSQQKETTNHSILSEGSRFGGTSSTILNSIL